ncbi:MAG: hypothetical protein V4537_03325 [Pseudomonadota bacterium]
MSKPAAPGSLVLDAAIALEAAAEQLSRAIETREHLVADFDAVRFGSTILAQLRTLESAISRADQSTLAAIDAANAALDRFISPKTVSDRGSTK